MSIEPLLTFKAGICDVEGDLEADPSSSLKVKPRPTPGYIYLYSEDDLMHFCWRPRNVPMDTPELDLLMFPMDGSYKPYKPTHAGNSNNPEKLTNGRIFVLKFASSSQKHFFWLQAKSQHPTQDPSWFSARDLKLGEIVDQLLQGDEPNIPDIISSIPPEDDEPGDNEDETMEDVEGTGDHADHHHSGSGGAGAGATGGDIRDEGEGSREGGANGGRANQMDASSIIQNFINSMPGAQGDQTAPQEKLFTTLADLLTTASTIPWIDQADASTVDQLLQFLPPALTTMAQEVDDGAELNTDHASIEASRQALSLDQKKDILRKVLRSPQFTQSLASLTVALRDGGLPIISESLNIPVKNGGYMRRGGVPLGGGEAVEVFLEGVKSSVSKQDDGTDKMDRE